MSDSQTSHYDTFMNTGRSVMVLDSIRAVCEAINNDALASSKEQPVIAGIENPCATLGSSSQFYTTIPLRPLTGDCNFLLNNYIHHRIPIMCKIDCEKVQTFNANGTYTKSADTNGPVSNIDFAIYTLSSSLLPKHFQLMIGNTVIYQNTFQRTEATVTINSLPPDVVEKSDDITTMSKLMNRKVIPGAYLTWDATPIVDTTTNTTSYPNTKTFTFIIDTTIDMQRFAPIISNLAFIPVEYGDIKLRLFYEDLLNALDISILPSQRNSNGTNGKISHNNLNVIERKPLMSEEGISFIEPQITTLTNTTNGTKEHTSPDTNPDIYPQQINVTHGADAPSTAITTTGGDTFVWKVDKTKCGWGTTVDSGNMLVEIVQSTFRLREESKILLKNYIMQDNRLIIPTHTWSTALGLSKMTQHSAEALWNFSAYNIDMLAITFPLTQAFESYLPTPQFKDFDVKLNSKSVNYIPYKGIDARFIKDTKQAFLNTDEYATNENLTYSLRRYNSLVGTNINDTGTLTKSIYSSYKCNSNTIDYKPNTFCYAINLTPPNSFEKGMCVASSNPQAAQVRLTYNLDTDNAAPTSAIIQSKEYNHLWSNVYELGTSSDKITSNPMILALQACCLVLIYNPIIGACQAGEVVFVEPFVE